MGRHNRQEHEHAQLDMELTPPGQRMHVMSLSRQYCAAAQTLNASRRAPSGAGGAEVLRRRAGLLGEVERLQEHDVLRAILDQGSDVRVFGRQYDSQLRSAELESIQDYILESDNLQLLHSQVGGRSAHLGAGQAGSMDALTSSSAAALRTGPALGPTGQARAQAPACAAPARGTHQLPQAAVSWNWRSPSWVLAWLMPGRTQMGLDASSQRWRRAVCSAAARQTPFYISSCS